MAEENLTTQILIGLRESIAKLQTDLVKLHSDMTEFERRQNEEHARTRSDLGRRVDQTNLQLKTTEARIATEISALRAMVANPSSEPDLRERVEKLERELAELKASKG